MPVIKASCLATQRTNARAYAASDRTRHRFGRCSPRPSRRRRTLASPDARHSVSLATRATGPWTYPASHFNPALADVDSTDILRICDPLARPPSTGELVFRSHFVHGEPSRQLLQGGPSAELRRHRTKDNRRHVRRRCPSRRRSVQRQGPVESGSQRSLLLPICCPSGCTARVGKPRGNSGGVCDRTCEAFIVKGRDLRHRGYACGRIFRPPV